MRTLGCLCLLSVLAQGVATSAASAQSRADAASTARLRSAAGLLAAPSLAALENLTVGWAAHVQKGLAMHDVYDDVWGLTVDAPITSIGSGHQSRLGFGLALMDGLCPTGVLLLPRSCILGYAMGVNLTGIVGSKRLPALSPSMKLAVGWSLDVGMGSVKAYAGDGTDNYDRQRSTSAGVSAPILFSFRFSRDAVAIDDDPRFNPLITIVLEPGATVGGVYTDWGEPGVIPQFSAGATILDLGPGFGISAVARKTVGGGPPFIATAALTYHAQRKP